MRILFASFWYYPHIGGISTHIQMLKKGLEKLGHQVLIFSGSLVDQLASNFSDEIKEQHKQLLIEGTHSSYTLNYELRRSLFHITAQHINFDLFDVIHFHDAVVASILGPMTKKTKVLTLHGYLANEAISEKVISRNTEEENYLLKIEEEALEYCDTVITVDSKIKDYIKEQFSYQQNIVVMKNFIDIWQLYSRASKEELRKRLSLSSSDYVIVCPRRLVEKNGVIYAAMAMKIVVERIPHAKLLCFGAGPQQEAIQNYIDHHHLKQNCILAGSVEHEVVKTFIQAADTIVIPSVPSEGVEEATSIAAIEGMALGKIVIASSIGGLKELITPHETGLLVPPFDVQELAKAIILAHKERQQLEKISLNSRKYILTHHSHTQAAKEIEKIYLNKN